MKKSILTMGILMVLSPSVWAVECSSIDGIKMLDTYWGHGQGWVEFPDGSEFSSFTGPFRNWVIASNNSDASLTFIKINDANFTWIGILKTFTTEIRLNCK